MPINVISDYPGRGGRRGRMDARIVRQAVTASGFALVAIGFAGSVMLTLYGGGGFIDLLEGNERTVRDIWTAVPLLVLGTGATILCWKFGLRLIRGERRLVLFLRRFGFVDATEALTHALDGTVGTSWRVVTLDDAQVAPVGVKQSIHRLRRAGCVVAVTAALFATYLLKGGPLPFLGPEPDDNLLDAAHSTIGAAMTQAYLAVVAMALLLAAALYTVGAYALIRRSERASALEISTRRDITATTLAVARLTRAIISPRLVVVRVEGAIWQEVVRRFSAHCAVVVIDVSEPSENLLWEIETLGEVRSRWLLVGERHRLHRLVTAVPEECSPVDQRLLDVLDGDDVLVYGEDDGHGNRFARALHAGFETIAERQRTSCGSA